MISCSEALSVNGETRHAARTVTKFRCGMVKDKLRPKDWPVCCTRVHSGSSGWSSGTRSIGERPAACFLLIPNMVSAAALMSRMVCSLLSTKIAVARFSNISSVDNTTLTSTSLPDQTGREPISKTGSIYWDSVLKSV